MPRQLARKESVVSKGRVFVSQDTPIATRLAWIFKQIPHIVVLVVACAKQAKPAVKVFVCRSVPRRKTTVAGAVWIAATTPHTAEVATTPALQQRDASAVCVYRPALRSSSFAEVCASIPKVAVHTAERAAIPVRSESLVQMGIVWRRVRLMQPTCAKVDVWIFSPTRCIVADATKPAPAVFFATKAVVFVHPTVRSAGATASIPKQTPNTAADATAPAHQDNSVRRVCVWRLARVPHLQTVRADASTSKVRTHIAGYAEMLAQQDKSVSRDVVAVRPKRPYATAFASISNTMYCIVVYAKIAVRVGMFVQRAVVWRIAPKTPPPLVWADASICSKQTDIVAHVTTLALVTQYAKMVVVSPLNDSYTHNQRRSAQVNDSAL